MAKDKDLLLLPMDVAQTVWWKRPGVTVGLGGGCLLFAGAWLALFALPQNGTHLHTQQSTIVPSVIRGVHPNRLRHSVPPLRAADGEVESFREKLMQGAISQRRMEKWTSKGRQAKVERAQAAEAAAEAAEEAELGVDDFFKPDLDGDDEFEDDYETVDPSTADSFAFGDEDMERADMQPANELEELRGKAFSAWPEKGSDFFTTKMAQVFFGGFTFAMVWLAISSDVGIEPVGVTYAVLLSSVLVNVFVVSLWIDWNYVGDRLKDDKVFYEKSGWYDGDLWQKPRDVAQRDSLLYQETITPILNLLKPWLQGSLAFTLAMFVLLQVIRPDDPYASADDPGSYRQTQQRITYRPSGFDDLED